MKLAPQTINQLMSPGQLQAAFIKYLQKAGARIDNSKSIAGVSYFDYRLLAGAQTVSFFQGAAAAPNTNLNNFVRPDSEHFLITGIHISNDISVVAAGVPVAWRPGISGWGFPDGQNSVMTITNNGIVELEDYSLDMSSGYLTTIDMGLIVLEEPILWLGQTELKIEVRNLVRAFQADQKIKITLLGIGLV